jgi:hypothetical protein
MENEYGILVKIKAKFDSVCTETGFPIKKGDPILWAKGTKQVYCLDSKEAQHFFEAKFDEEILSTQNNY